MKLEVKKLTCGYGKNSVFSGIDIEVESGELLCLLGPNGVGKTTLFKTVLGLLEPLAGNILVNGKDIHDMQVRERARLLSYVPQSSNIVFPFTAYEVVLMGRSPWIYITGHPGKEDRKIAMEAMDILSISHLKSKEYSRMSGGEKQLVLIARAICQQSKFLILDEPTSSLDFGNQSVVLDEVRNLRELGVGVIMTTHNPNHVFHLGGSTLLMGKDNSIRKGKPCEVLTEESIQDVFGVSSRIVHEYSSRGRISYCVPVRKSLRSEIKGVI